MTNAEFVVEFKELVKTERKITRQVLEWIIQAEDRKVHLELGFSSLFEWLVKDIGYSESAASRRISSARLLRSVPAAAGKLESGEVNLTTLAQAKAAMRAHTKATGEKFSSEQQSEMIDEISNKTSREVQATLFEKFPETTSSVHQERRTALSEELTRLAFNFNKERMNDLKWMTNFLSHIYPDGDLADIFGRAIREFRKNEEAKGTRAVAKVAQGKETKSAARRVSLHQAERRCEYRDPVSGRVCGTSFMAQTDHITPRALGGEDRLQNYRCLCWAHNQFVAEQKLGEVYRKARRRWS